MVSGMTRTAALAIAIAAVVVAAALAAGYAYFFSGLRAAPKPLALASATPAAGATTASAAPPTALAGTWTVASGSQAGYRVSEVFAGTTSPHEAVARTSAVSGRLRVAAAADGLEVSGVQLTAQLASLRSVDTVAGRDVALRDRIVSQTLSVSQYPTATFQSQGAAVPAGLEAGRAVQLTLPGQLTIRGVTRPVQVSVQARLSGGQVQAAGSTSFVMTDFGFEPPRLPITTVDAHVTMDFALVLTRG
jgi:polyisoprenoid-binding protein YceI